MDRHSWISTSRWSAAKKSPSERWWLRGEISDQTNTCLCVCTEHTASALRPGEPGEFRRLQGRRLSCVTYIGTHAWITPLHDPRTVPASSVAGPSSAWREMPRATRWLASPRVPENTHLEFSVHLPVVKQPANGSKFKVRNIF